MPDHRDDAGAVTPADRDAAGAAEQPPLGSWPRLYAIVLGELALLILLFTLFARAFE